MSCKLIQVQSKLLSEREMHTYIKNQCEWIHFCRQGAGKLQVTQHVSIFMKKENTPH